MRSGSLGIGGLVTGANDNSNLLSSGSKRLLDQNPEQGLLIAVFIDEGLERQRALRPQGGRDYSFLNSQLIASRYVIPDGSASRLLSVVELRFVSINTGCERRVEEPYGCMEAAASSRASSLREQPGASSAGKHDSDHSPTPGRATVLRSTAGEGDLYFCVQLAILNAGLKRLPPLRNCTDENELKRFLRGTGRTERL
jgi:hypothetical protein